MNGCRAREGSRALALDLFRALHSRGRRCADGISAHLALAKDLLRRNEGRVAEIAQRVGYSSASTFSVAFTRHVGRPPTQCAREEQAAANVA